MPHRSERTRKLISQDDFYLFLHENDFDVGIQEDPKSYDETIKSSEANKWRIAMQEEIESMKVNKVWDLIPLPEGCGVIESKWVFKTKRDSIEKIVHYKARLVAKGYTLLEGVDYNEPFLPVCKKDSLRVILVVIAYLNLELHQMDVKTSFLNGILKEEVFMDQPKGFQKEGGEVCKLKRSIYGFKQASRQ